MEIVRLARRPQRPRVPLSPLPCLLLAGFVLAAASACSRHDHGPGSHSHDAEADAGHGETQAEAEPWAVTAWGERFEIFPEIDPLIAGRAAAAHTHVTRLADFSPVAAGRAAIVLRAADGSEEVFAADQVKRPGIFPIEVTPRAVGEFELLFRIETAAEREEIAGGRVRVGSAEDPGGLIAPPPASARAEQAAGAAGGEEISFLKEQQWKVPFATVWATEGELAATRRAPGKVLAAPGGDRTITAPADGVVLARPFPYSGLRLAAGAPLFALTPGLDPERSLAGLEGELAGAEARLNLARSESARATRLAAVGAMATAEKERAEAALAIAEAQAAAARRDLATARSARSGGGRDSEAIRIPAPFAGAVAAVAVSAGEAVAAGETLGRFVATGPPWVEAWLAPDALVGLAPGPARLSLAAGGTAAAEMTDLEGRLVAVAPALDPSSGRRTLLFALAAELPALAIGQAVEVEFAAGAARRGMVVPAGAVIDDAGVAIVYLQVSGEALQRREVRVLGRAGGRLLIAGVAAGERLVTVGGAAVRRASLVDSGVGEGHVH